MIQWEFWCSVSKLQNVLCMLSSTVSILLSCLQLLTKLAIRFRISTKCIHDIRAVITFSWQDNIISTPLLTGTILPGITRRSVIEISQNLGFQVTQTGIFLLVAEFVLYPWHLTCKKHFPFSLFVCYKYFSGWGASYHNRWTAWGWWSLLYRNSCCIVTCWEHHLPWKKVSSSAKLLVFQ